MRLAFYTLLARLRAFVRPAAAEADFDEEIDAHLAMAEDDHVRRGMSREAARREARLALGGVTQLRESARAARGLPWLETFWLDGRLGLRMLRKSWGLTLVGGLAMALTIGLGASIVTIWDTFAGTSLPLDEGDRVVAIQRFDRSSQRAATTVPWSDVERWRDALRSLEHVSAMRAIDPVVATAHATLGPVRAAGMTASAFQVARVQPLLGRPLVDADVRAGAAPVAVIGYALWQSAYASDPAVLGQTLQVDDTPHTIVGVMPDGFRFPLNQRLWIPLRAAGAGGGGEVVVFARLAPGATLESAQSELTTVGVSGGASGGAPAIEPRVVPYAAGFFPDVHANAWAGGLLLLLAALLLAPPCANIAILVYARTIARRAEFAARTALGASRARIVMQLFVEVLVLAAGAGLAGLLLARQFSGRVARIVMPWAGPENLPFWMDFSPSPVTVVCVAGLVLLAAAMAGGIPAWHATSRWRHLGVSALDGWGSGARLGKTWIALLATQVALTLTILPSAAEMVWGVFRPAILGPGLPVEEFLTAPLVTQGDSSRVEGLAAQVAGQLRADAALAGVTVSATVPLEEPFADIEVEGGESSGVQARFNSVDGQYFEVFGARMLAGRRFDAGDVGRGRTPVIVNRSFVTEILGGGTGLGRRVRYRDTAQTRRTAPPPGAHEIVGVVDDFPGDNDGPMMFHPLTPAARAITVTVRAASGLAPAAGRLRAAASGVEPRLQFGPVRSLEDIYWQRRSADHTFGLVLATMVLIVVAFSLAGLYTLMTFIVAQRWREIGVRMALGASSPRLVSGMFGRALVPLTLGAAVGSALAVRLHSWLPIVEAGGQRIPGIVPLSAAMMILVGLAAAAGPARRAIRIDPVRALRVS